MHIRGGTNGGIVCQDAGGKPLYCTNVRIQDIHFDSFSRMTLEPFDAVINFAYSLNCSTPPYDDLVIDGITIAGDPGVCFTSSNPRSGGLAGKVCGSRTSAMFTTLCGVTIRNSTFKDMEGNITRFWDEGVFENNYVEHVWGLYNDGQLQNYNNKHMTYRRNLFNHVSPANDMFAVIRVRRTSNNECSRPPCGSTPGAEVYNNTFIGENGDHGAGPTICAGAASDCPPNTFQARHHSRAFESHARDDQTVGPYDAIVSVRNIYAHYTGATGSGALQVGHHGTPSACPRTLRLEGDLFTDNTSDVTTRCTGIVETPAVVDPGLDPNLAPASAASAACKPVSSDFTSRVGRFCYTKADCAGGDTCSNNFCSTKDTADPWAGARQGACGASKPRPAPSPRAGAR